jgi:hypothetical protein
VKIDNRIIYLVISPLIAVILCAVSPYVLPKNTSFTPEQPEFLTYVDKLSVFTIKGEQDPPANNIKDVFRHEWTGLIPNLDALTAIRNTGGVKPAPPSVSVSMIVDEGKNSYCIINGRKMHRRDKADNFRITSIGKDFVTIIYKNGTRETHHVKVY